MVLLYSHPLFLEHKTGSHPEKPRRLERILAELEAQNLTPACIKPTWEPISRRRLERLHGAKYIDEVAAYTAAGGGRIETDTVVSEQSYAAALLAAGAACDAVERVLRGEDSRGLCLVRPPGHHALANAPMGFCLFGNVSLAAQLAIDEFGLDRVVIVDWDVHHGNGTQDLFWENEQVGFFSIHRFPFYPGTGDANETGTGCGLGTTRNVPIAYGTSRPEFLSRFQTELSDFCQRMKPQLILVSAGFDAHREDPVGSLDLEVEDFGKLTQVVLQLAAEHAGGKLVSVLEGGYHIHRLAESVAEHLRQLQQVE